MPSKDPFHWEPQPAAQALVDQTLAAFLARFAEAAELSRRLKDDAGTRFKDWVDSIEVPGDAGRRAQLAEVGFERRDHPGATECWAHHRGMFPRFLLGPGPRTAVSVKVESVTDFLTAWNLTDEPGRNPVQGGPWSPLRRALAWARGNDELWAVERHGYQGFDAADAGEGRVLKSLRHLEALRRRRREWDDDLAGFAHTGRLVDAASADLGVHAACDLFFIAEREFWQRRNRAGMVQKARQDRLGVGWANHDHHTYRTSRRCFAPTIALLERLGFHCRERFYAGAEAGWGAQVLEQPTAAIVIFADVDLSPEEVAGDFSHSPLPERKELGTVGLWCGLHGDSMLRAGMHHLECQFDHHALVAQLGAASIRTMDPFTNFPFLRQAFTEGERWPVDPARVDRLVRAGLITADQGAKFKTEGAIGSHMENLERNDGYKGFNQRGVSEIIAKTDPRKQVAGAGA